MIVYVDIEHHRVKENKAQWDRHLQRTLDIKYKLEAISGDLCLIVRYDKLTPKLLRDLNVRAVLVSGNVTEFQHYDEADLADGGPCSATAHAPPSAFVAGRK